MSTDPRPRTAQNPNGGLDAATEERFRVIFASLRDPLSPRPTGAASSLAFLQELHDRLHGR